MDKIHNIIDNYKIKENIDNIHKSDWRVKVDDEKNSLRKRNSYLISIIVLRFVINCYVFLEKKVCYSIYMIIIFLNEFIFGFWYESEVHILSQNIGIFNKLMTNSKSNI